MTSKKDLTKFRVKKTQAPPINAGLKIEFIISSIRSGSVSITDHADEEAFNDNLKYE